MPPVVTIGDGIVDAVQTSDAPPVLYPGGAGLNLAVGLARLGVPSALAARVGADRHGFRLMRYLREEGVNLINTPNVDFTGLVTSLRVDGEPSYHFTPSMYRRRIAFNAALRNAMALAPVVAVNSFSFEDPRQAEALGDALDGATGLRILDPNVRPRLVSDLAAFRQGFERTLPKANLVKLSEEDASLLYGREDDGIAADFFARGVDVVLLTRGKAGAGVFTRTGIGVSLPATALSAPIVDTMGAGDATLASVIAFILAAGMPADQASWRACLKQAMDIAAATCRSAGGALLAPRSPRCRRIPDVVSSQFRQISFPHLLPENSSEEPVLCRWRVRSRFKSGPWAARVSASPRSASAAVRSAISGGRSTDEAAADTVAAAWEAGIRYFDVAPLYGHGRSETRLGRGLAEKPRAEFVLSTKVGRLLRPPASPNFERHGFIDTPDVEVVYDYSRDGALRSLEESLARLGLERADIVLIHDVDRWTHGDRQPQVFREALDGAYRALADLKAAGVVRAIGIGVNEWQVCRDFALRAPIDCVLLAGRYTLLEQEAAHEFLPLCVERGIGVIVGGPFNSGILATGPAAGAQYNYAPAPPAVLERVARIKGVVEAHGVSLPAAGAGVPAPPSRDRRRHPRADERRGGRLGEGVRDGADTACALGGARRRGAGRDLRAPGPPPFRAGSEIADLGAVQLGDDAGEHRQEALGMALVEREAERLVHGLRDEGGDAGVLGHPPIGAHVLGADPDRALEMAVVARADPWLHHLPHAPVDAARREHVGRARRGRRRAWPRWRSPRR